MGVVYIGDSTSTAKETNQAPPWLRYTGDQRDACKDWGASGATGGVAAPRVRPHPQLLPLA